jgi:hypothetical protein
VLSNGSRLSLRTSLARGAEHTVAIANPPKKSAERESGAPEASDRPAKKGWAAIQAFQVLGKMGQLKSLLSRLPYRRLA